MSFKWYHVFLFFAVIIGITLFSIPPDFYMLTLESRSGLVARAQEYINHTISNKPPNWNNLEELLDIFIAQGSSDEVIPMLNDYLAIDPTNIEARVKLSNIWRSKLDIDEAINAMQSPGHLSHPAKMQLVNLYIEGGYLDEARNLLTDMIEEEGEDLLALQDLAQIYRWENAPVKEAAILERLYRIQPDDAVLDRLFDIYMWQEMPDDAARVAAYLLIQNNVNPIIMRNVRNLYINLSDSEKALQAANKLVLSPHATINDYLMLARLYDWTGRSTQAIHVLESGYVKYPENLTVMRFIATLYFANKEYDQAAKWMLQIAEKTDLADDWYAAISLLRDSQRYEEGQKRLNALAYGRSDLQFLWLGATMAQLGDDTELVEKYREWFEEYIQAHPGDTEAQAFAQALEPSANIMTVQQSDLQGDDILPVLIDPLVIAARNAAKNGDYRRATHFYEEYLDQNPMDAWIWIELGNMQKAAGQDGMPAMQEAMRLMPLDGTAERYALHARTAINAGELEQAAALLYQAMLAAPEDRTFAYDYVDTLIRMEEYSKALTTLNQLERVSPLNERGTQLRQILDAEQARPLLLSAREAARAANYAAAIRDMRMYLALQPDDGWAWYELAEFQSQYGENATKARVAALNSLPLDGSAERYALHARIRAQLHQIDKARALYLEAMVADRENMDIPCDYVEFLLQNKELIAAAEVLDQQDQMHPPYRRRQELHSVITAEMARPLLTAARQAVTRHDEAEAIRLYNQYLDLQPLDGWAWNELGEIQYQQDPTQLAALQKALELLPLDGVSTELYALHARVREREGNKDEAERLYLEAMDLDPNNIDIPCDYVDLLQRYRHYDKALDLLDDLDERQPPYVRRTNLRALIDIEMGRYKRALDSLRYAFEVYPEDYELEAVLAYAEEINGNWKRAIEHYEGASQKAEVLESEADRVIAFRKRIHLLELQNNPEVLYTYRYKYSELETTETQIVGGQGALTERIRLAEFFAHLYYVYEPKDAAEATVADMDLFNITATWSPYRWITPWFSAFMYTQNEREREMGWAVGTAWQPVNKVSTTFAYRQRVPWDDNVYGVLYDGQYDEISASMYARFFPRVNFSAVAQRREYRAMSAPGTSIQDGGTAYEAIARLEYELIFSPEQIYGTGFNEPRFQYEDTMNLALLPYISYRYLKHDIPDGFTAVPITERSAAWTLGLDYYKPFNTRWALHAGVYTGSDPERNLEFGKLYGARAKVLYTFRDHLRFYVLYEMVSETISGLDEGKTHYFYLGVNYIF